MQSRRKPPREFKCVSIDLLVSTENEQSDPFLHV